MKKKYNGKIFAIIVVAILSLLGGITGDLVFRTYFYNTLYGLPMAGEINYSDGNYNGTNLIIRDAKKVVVEQSQKTQETIQKANSSLAGIYKKKSTATSTVSLDNYYLPGDQAGQGCIITSDGWILTTFKNFKDAIDLRANYVVITKDKKIHKIDKVISDKSAQASFVHIDSKGLSISGFIESGTLKVGDSLLAIDFNDSALISTIVNFREKNKVMMNSDNEIKRFYLNNELIKNYKGVFLFDYSGNLAGVVDDAGVPQNISNYSHSINSILRYGSIKKAGLGITYINAEDLAGFPLKKGAVVKSVSKGSLAEAAGLKEGSVITAVNGSELSREQDLSDVFSAFFPGDTITLTLEAQGESKNINIALKEVIVK